MAAAGNRGMSVCGRAEKVCRTTLGLVSSLVRLSVGARVWVMPVAQVVVLLPVLDGGTAGWARR